MVIWNGQFMPAVRVLPWVSVQPSLFDVVQDVRYGVQGTHGMYEDVWATVSLAAQGIQLSLIHI